MTGTSRAHPMQADQVTTGRAPAPPVLWELRLYVAGESPKSLTAITNLQRICEEHLAGRYSIEVIDLLEQPQLAQGDEIIAVPTLVRQLPQPIRKIIGDLRDTDRVLVGLQLRPAGRGDDGPRA